jgi:hypothetical protein
MYDFVRWIILGLFFVALVGAWLWARRQEAQRKTLGKELGASFRIVQKRWLDKGTGVCLVESEERTFLLAYTVGGGVSWQEVEPKPEESPESAPENRLKPKFEFPVA